MTINKGKHDGSKYTDVANLMETFGKYQVIQYALICAPAVFVTMININYVFVAGDLDYRCNVPECEDGGTFQNFPQWWPDNTIDRCHRPVLKAGDWTAAVCTNESFTNQVEECTDWIYESNNTIVAELDLACRPWLSNLIGTIHNCGMLFSMVISGWMSDRFGRKPTLIFCVVGSCIGLVKTFATSYLMYVLIEFLESAISGGSYAAAMVLMLEISGKKNRIHAGIIFSCSVYFGESVFACIAMLVPYWKTLVRIINGPSIFFISYILLIRESPRWQTLNGKTEEAKDTLLKVAQMNNININVQELNEANDVQLKEKFNIVNYEKREGLKQILTSKVIMKRLLVAAVCRFTSSFVYYGLMINSVWLPGNKHTNFLLTTIMSFPGEMISLLVLDRIGRKLPIMVGYILCGILCVTSGFVPTSYVWIRIMLFLVGKAIISMCFTGALTYTMELFPTSTRGALLGFGSFASRSGAMLAPLTPILNSVSESLPGILFGCSAVITGCLLTLTPETKDLPLMDTIKQLEEIERTAKEMKNAKEHTQGADNLSYNNESVI